MLLILLVIGVALVFEYINGFHDTANSIATVVSTKVVTPRQAIILATVFNLLGALAGTAVAATIGKGLVDTQFVTLPVILCGLIAGIVWNLITWWMGLPSSSSHALIGGLCGATLAKAGSDWSVIHWTLLNPKTGAHEGLLYKVIIPMFTSPMMGLIGGFVLMMLLIILLKNWRPAMVNRIFGKLQLVSASWMAFSHGSNDAQKTMGIVTLTLFTATAAGSFDSLPAWADFLRVPEFSKTVGVPFWVKLTCALTMAAGTAAGGWRIIRTLGHKMVKLQPVHGFAAETTAAAIIQVASHWGIPLSTTHVISSAIMGVGASKRLNAVKWSIVQRMVIAWVLTIPLTGTIGYVLVRVFHMA
ncbi:MAG: inorganic phosphate transporter [Verrucomicrobiota bacterium]|nr:inorganic phosphate transporter [Verrucomicrobiota bacterium]